MDMSLLSFLQVLAVIGTIMTGLVSLVRPKSVQKFTGLRAKDGRGITEIRSILGAVFVGLGASALVLDHAVSYPMLGLTYLVIGGVRVLSMFLDDSVERSNVISAIVEIAFGVVLVL